MIVRITVNDNDYTQCLEKIVPELVIKAQDYLVSRTGSAHIIWKNYKKFCDIIGPETGALTETQKEFAVSVFRKTLEYLIRKKFDAEHSKYMLNDLRVSIVDTYEEKWENGEVLYYFTLNDKYLEN